MTDRVDIEGPSDPIDGAPDPVSVGEVPEPWSATLARAGLNLIPIVGGSIDVLAARVNEGMVYKRRQLYADVLRRVQVEELVAALDRDPVLEAVWSQAVLACVRTGVTAKRRLLAKVISQAVLDDALVEQTQLVVDALEHLDAPHLRALERFRRFIDSIEPQTMQVKTRARELWHGEPVPIRAALVRTGCSTAPITPIGGLSMPSYTQGMLSDFGRQLLDWVRECDDERDGLLSS
ncbi:hypothetical protein [Cellulomonas humilata]|uniref:DUF4158 domain-containing protein n=1 Tax=Cellulomonas humilata TaxID=144055 RepID=A0ABU0EL13_9CELL|nr:hypothetical protein [Cellulomonas humilata]MDQ0375975.1 hypothetical protein [Cellulomonas humilata]